MVSVFSPMKSPKGSALACSSTSWLRTISSTLPDSGWRALRAMNPMPTRLTTTSPTMIRPILLPFLIQPPSYSLPGDHRPPPAGARQPVERQAGADAHHTEEQFAPFQGEQQPADGEGRQHRHQGPRRARGPRQAGQAADQVDQEPAAGADR